MNQIFRSPPFDFPLRLFMPEFKEITIPRRFNVPFGKENPVHCQVIVNSQILHDIFFEIVSKSKRFSIFPANLFRFVTRESAF